MRPRAVDKNQAVIVAALRDVGATVTDLHDFGRGVPDLLVGFRGVNYLLEVKGEAGHWTDREQAWFAEWRGQAAVVYDIDDALSTIGAI